MKWLLIFTVLFIGCGEVTIRITPLGNNKRASRTIESRHRYSKPKPRHTPKPRPTPKPVADQLPPPVVVPTDPRIQDIIKAIKEDENH